MHFKIKISDKSFSGGFRATFTDHAHSAAVRAVAAGGKFLLTSGGDENVKVYRNTLKVNICKLLLNNTYKIRG